MTLLANHPSTGTPRLLPPRGRAEERAGRRVERRRLARHDALAARLAELSRIGEVLAGAGTLVGEGWVQQAWFRYRDESGRTRLATAYDVDRISGQPVLGACLVGALVHAGGGPSAGRSQLVGRTLELTWHTLYDVVGEVRWTPSPDVRAAHVRDLTRWNDAPCRRPEQVAALLHATTEGALVQAAGVRRERSAT